MSRSSRPWRRLRLQILERDGHRCHVPIDGGRLCLKPATTVDHIRPLALGGAELDPANLRAACTHCNYSLGAQLAAQLRQVRARMDRWSRPTDRRW